MDFSWDLSSKTIEIPAEKKLRYLEKLEPRVPAVTFCRKQVESVQGTVVHCSLAITDGPSCFCYISTLASSFEHATSDFSCRTLKRTVLSDIA
ncbi:hypothetical protein K438DRAFT_1621062 [Mycena galopus ATCC 62051]|nr:hypothetical protein K438DRAFT_1621062 [Mycena galopus ATCC 62051]